MKYTNRYGRSPECLQKRKISIESCDLLATISNEIVFSISLSVEHLRAHVRCHAGTLRESASTYGAGKRLGAGLKWLASQVEKSGSEQTLKSKEEHFIGNFILNRQKFCFLVRDLSSKLCENGKKGTFFNGYISEKARPISRPGVSLQIELMRLQNVPI